ncbi:MAG: hypothetical protein QOK14_230, partial [Frankiaceae bacterium]|nr:hypothetical protein [Frankiaceae bacterium]
GPVHFDTPGDAMRYLARAYNCTDMVAMKRVTEPMVRDAFREMTKEAVDMQFLECTPQPDRAHWFTCSFTHHYPKGVKHENPGPDGLGRAYVTVSTAARPGFYALEDLRCG